MTIGEILKEKRTQRGLSLRKLSEEIGIHFMTLSKYERDAINPSIYMMWDLADYYNCSIDELCGRKEGSYGKEEN